MKRRTNELKKQGHTVCVFHDGDKLFLQMDGAFYQIRIDCDTEMEVINDSKPVTPIKELEEVPKLFQSKWIGYD